MEEYVYLNGHFVPKGEATISVFDRGFLYGDGLFETMRVYSRRVFMLDDHLFRLFDSIDQLKIPVKMQKHDLKSAIERLIELNNLFDAYVRLTVSRGIHTGTLTLDGNYEPTIVITAKELSPYPQEYYAGGTKVVIGSIRQNSFSPLSHHKSLNYLDNILAKEEAREKGVFEAILLNTEGYVSEGTVSNVFMVESGRVFTPSLMSHLLPGVTRKAVLEMIPQLNLKVVERMISMEEFIASDEVFLTNSIMEIMPVVEVDGEKIGGGKPGPVSRKVAEGYKGLVSDSFLFDD